jgi:hypothetical protein
MYSSSDDDEDGNRSTNELHYKVITEEDVSYRRFKLSKDDRSTYNTLIAASKRSLIHAIQK